MLRLVLILAVTFFLSQSAQADQVQFFPPVGPCTPDNPIVAWNGSGATYCTHFPTTTLPDCADGQFLTKKNGTLVCSNLTGTNVTAPTTPSPTAPTPTPAPTTPYSSSSTPTGIPQNVAATGGNNATTRNPTVVINNNYICPAVSVPACAADSVLVDYGPDFNGCPSSPQCQYVGYSSATYVAPYAPPYVEPYYDTAPVEDVPYYAPCDNCY